MKSFIQLAVGLASAAGITAAMTTAIGAAPAIPAYIAAAVASPDRPDADKKRDDGLSYVREVRLPRRRYHSDQGSASEHPSGKP